MEGSPELTVGILKTKGGLSTMPKDEGCLLESSMAKVTNPRNGWCRTNKDKTGFWPVEVFLGGPVGRK